VKVLDVADLGPRTRIGEGGEAAVYKSHLVHSPESVVCVKETKEILTHGIADVEDRRVSAVLASLLQELRISAHKVLKDHPNILHVVGVAFQQESFEAVRPLVVVELACGTLACQFPLSPVDERLRLSRDVADGLVALHAYGIVHGDVKGDNALVFARPTGLVAAISDFGGSCPEGSSDVIPATPEFFAPEVYNHSTLHSAHANRKPRDVYSFGLLLCQGVLGESVFGGIAPDERFVLQDKDGARSYVAEKLANLSGSPLNTDLRKIIDSCLVRHPGERPSMLEVSRRLSAMLGEVRCVGLTFLCGIVMLKIR
jgi:serine/threonine protein kinase